VHPRRAAFAWLNVVGGSAVLGSYAYSLATHPAPGLFWGGVPEGLRPVYTVSMFTAAAGYFAFTHFVFFCADPDRTRAPGGFGWGIFPLLYALILVSAALWMPLTSAMLASPGAGWWLAVRGVLAVTGLGSLGLAAALLRVEPREPAWAHRLAVAGSALFAWQTAVLDALVWPAFFRG
jgi:hypothetical protein